jgi:ribose-phosphate pyrophosphokinase
MEIVKYPDLTSYVKVKYTATDKDPKIFKVNSYEDLWHLNQYVDAYNDTFTKKPTIMIPNLIDAQADRRFNKNESFGLKLVCKFLNKMKANFRIFHPHNAELVEGLLDNVKIIDNSNFIARVITNITKCSFDNGTPRAWDDRKDNENLTSIDRYNNLILMSTDAGGFKPLMKLCDKIGWRGETESAAKSRKFVDSKSVLEQRIDRTDFTGKDILIIDDICIYGGTFKGLAKLLRERNCGKLYLAVSHMTVQNLGEDPVTNYFDKVFTTNSKYDSYFVKDSEAGGKQPDNLIVINMF